MRAEEWARIIFCLIFFSPTEDHLAIYTVDVARAAWIPVHVQGHFGLLHNFGLGQYNLRVPIPWTEAKQSQYLARDLQRRLRIQRSKDILHLHSEEEVARPPGQMVLLYF